MPEIYIGQYELDVSDPSRPRWRPPGGDAIGRLDIRSNNQIHRGPFSEGVALFVYPGFRSHPLLLRRLGNRLTDSVSSASRNLIAQHMGVPPGSIKSTTIGRVIRELFTSDGQGTSSPLFDPSGLALHKPVRMGSDQRVRIILGGFGDVINEPVNTSHPSFAATVAVFHADYRRNRAKGVPLRVLRKWTGTAMFIFFRGMSDSFARQILPPEFAKDGWDIPDTVILDNFNRANSATLGVASGGFSWAEVQNSGHEILDNKARSTGGTGQTKSSRAEFDFASDAQTSQIDVVTLPIPTSNDRAILAATCVRFSTDAAAVIDYYAMRMIQWHDKGGVSDEEETDMVKFVNGVETEISSFVTQSFSLPDTIAIEMTAGDVFTGSFNGSDDHTGTDTSITGILRTGIQGFNRDDEYEVDNYEAFDPEVPIPPSRNWPTFGQRIYNSSNEENRPTFGQRIARATD